MSRTLKVRCPVCRRQVAWKENDYRPFCSERCKLIDLGEWIGEGYRISTPLNDELETDFKLGEDDPGGGEGRTV